MATLAISRDMLTQYSVLPKPAQAKVAQIADRFRQMTAVELRGAKGLHLERHKGQKDPRARTIRIDDNHRGVVFDNGDDELFVLTRIETHDDVDRWMAHNTFKVNVATGALEIINTVAIDAAIAEAPVPAADIELIFAHRRDKDFTQLGIDADLIPALRAFRDEDQLMGLLGVLPQTQADALIMLTGTDSVDTIYREIAGSETPTEVDPDDVAGALRSPASQAQFTILADNDELQEMLAKPLAQWRTYLHPSQREAAFRSYNGPARVTGGAGTGKTVVAIHRAAHLADELDDRTGRPILFTTFTKNLAQSIERDLRELAGSDVLDVVEVLNVDRLAYRVVQDAEGIGPSIALDFEVDDMWRDVVDERGIDYSPEFLRNEWEQVVFAQGLRSRDEYFTASRTGRGVRLDRRQRAIVWKAIESLNRKLIDADKRTYLQLSIAAAGYLSQRSVKPYQHVVVDEGQDLHEAQWRLLRAAVDEQPDDMFIVGDSHQRIYNRRSSLSKVGINIVGRSRKLRINYRTTYEILGFSLGVLGEAEFDDLDEGIDTQDLAGYHSFLHGSRPTTVGLRSAKEQLDAMGERVRQWVESGVAEDEIAVCARTSSPFDALERSLKDHGVATCVLAGDLPTRGGVRIATMHRLKGLEFRCVAIVDCDDDTIPARWELADPSVDPMQHDQDLRREQCLLYVACTRARDELWLGWAGNPSRFLPEHARAPA